jgi:formyltetrahydrofolate deformylase
MKGLVSRVARFFYDHGGNILDLDEHVDRMEKMFFLRVAWDMSDFTVAPGDVEEELRPLAGECGAHFSIRLGNEKRRLAIFVSRHDHCLQEILWRQDMGEFHAEIPLVISNHPDAAALAGRYHIPFHLVPMEEANRVEQEGKEIALLDEAHVDTIILARYMQILSPAFIGRFQHRIINIHHSFLPAFAGGNPYKQAFDRGVKIIGATSHYATELLDDGPIIDQDIIRISHKDSLEDLIRKGRDLERLVLARALRLHIEDRVLVHGRKTVVFD